MEVHDKLQAFGSEIIPNAAFFSLRGLPLRRGFGGGDVAVTSLFFWCSAFLVLVVNVVLRRAESVSTRSEYPLRGFKVSKRGMLENGESGIIFRAGRWRRRRGRRLLMRSAYFFLAPFFAGFFAAAFFVAMKLHPLPCLNALDHYVWYSRDCAPSKTFLVLRSVFYGACKPSPETNVS